MKFFLIASYSLWSREIKRFYRQRSRVVGAMASPLVFWIFIGSGMGRAFSIEGGDSNLGYLEYFFPGTLLLIVLFTSIFSTISLIEDRREGFLQCVLVAPISRASIVLGKILGGAVLATMQGVLFLLIAPWIGIHLSLTGWIVVLLVLFLNSFGLTALGFLLAWRMQSIQGFHAIMNLLLMPLWLLSGALFPAEDSPLWLEWLVKLNPLSYGLAALRHALYEGKAGILSLPAWNLSLTISLVFASCLFILAALISSKRRVEDLPT